MLWTHALDMLSLNLNPEPYTEELPQSPNVQTRSHHPTLMDFSTLRPLCAAARSHLEAVQLVSDLLPSLPYKQLFRLQDRHVKLLKPKQRADSSKLSKQPVAHTHVVREEITGTWGRDRAAEILSCSLVNVQAIPCHAICLFPGLQRQVSVEVCLTHGEAQPEYMIIGAEPTSTQNKTGEPSVDKSASHLYPIQLLQEKYKHQAVGCFDPFKVGHHLA